ncbi:flagellar biosynthesis regulator FlaF [Falsirhodobacter sp. 20TX0035]|uniref:flagellar biosynthesis regulator FlaF n=1 Tax=Falsirhodobacter sp. 20TX0035 TaxID=3022019 RepID=UPI0023302E8B|nr:flagellar biosynthesis regulator FlaF [Falsirhodobacter sp. 20TX0035]MDB6452494.1 flagellar biosynthesis regulator FlaF [Falsirhodobacter sp. 20TX0035]
MNAYTSQNAYGRADAPLRDARSIEYDVFARVTRALTAATAQRDTGFPAYAKALHDNQRLWMALAADLGREGNGFPAPLKAQLFYLFKFTAQHTPKALKKEAGLEVLIEINTSVMRGLRGEAA